MIYKFIYIYIKTYKWSDEYAKKFRLPREFSISGMHSCSTLVFIKYDKSAVGGESFYRGST